MKAALRNQASTTGGSGSGSGSGGTGDAALRPATLLLLDRASDAITPLLSQWTYQAMAHELLHMNNNRIDLSRVNKTLAPDVANVVLASSTDEFFRRHMFATYGDLGPAVARLRDEFKVPASCRFIQKKSRCFFFLVLNLMALVSRQRGRRNRLIPWRK